MGFRFVMAVGAAPDLDLETEFLKDERVEVEFASLKTPEEVRRETVSADGVIVALEPLPAELIDNFQPEVRIIGRAGIGLDTIDLEAARRRGVAVFHTPDYATEEVATHAVAMILAASRRIIEGNGLARTDWGSYEKLGSVIPLSERVVGVVGLGRIGRAVVDRLLPFGPRIIGLDPFVATAPEGVTLASRLEELLTSSDIVTLHVPLTPETTKLIGAHELGLLRPGTMLVNVSRGRVIDEDALVDALESGRISAALDVLAVEPPPADARILSAPNVILTPHFAWYSDSSERRVRTEVLRGMLDYLRGQPLTTGRLAVDPHGAEGNRDFG